MIYAAIIIGSWFLTIITYMLGYNLGKIAGVNEANAQMKPNE